MMRAGSFNISVLAEVAFVPVFSLEGSVFWRIKNSVVMMLAGDSRSSKAITMAATWMKPVRRIKRSERTLENYNKLTSSFGTGGMTGGLGLRSVRYIALESSSSDGGTFSFRWRSSHWMEDNIYYKLIIKLQTVVLNRKVAHSLIVLVRQYSEILTM